MKRMTIWYEVEKDSKRPSHGQKILAGYKSSGGRRSITVAIYYASTDVWVNLVTNGRMSPDYWAVIEHPAD